MEEKQQTASRILSVTEEELQRIILDIHDGSVQNIFAALSKIQAIQLRHESNRAMCDDDMQQLAQVTQLLTTALQEIRNVLGTMRPPSFANKTLADIIQSVIYTHETFTECEVIYRCSDRSIQVSLPVKIALYRICQEALNNAHRHSGSKTQTVQLSKQENCLLLSIHDDGKGFVPPPLDGPEATEREEHIGLRGMRDRIHLVGGTMTLESSPDQGTAITVKVAIND